MPNNRDRDLIRDLARFIGETVTIFTTSGGESGRGFTGVLIGIDPDFVRLLAQIGPAPGCALGSCCDRDRRRRGSRRRDDEDFEDGENENLRFECGRPRNTGAVVDIPVNRIAAFVHNAI